MWREDRQWADAVIVTAGCYVLILAVGVAEAAFGRYLIPFGDGSRMCVWDSDVLQQQVGTVILHSSSQCICDCWTLTHFEHGLWYVLFIRFLRRHVFHCTEDPVIEFLIGMYIEASWEILENTPALIASFCDPSYSGDSILNSIGDMIACAIGLCCALHLTTKRLVLLLVCCELLTYVWFQDGVLIASWTSLSHLLFKS